MPALAGTRARLAPGEGPTIEVHAPEGRLAARPADARPRSSPSGARRWRNVVKHAQRRARPGSASRSGPGRVVVEIRDDGLGFEPDVGHPGHFGLESMRSRAAEIGGAAQHHERARPGHRRPDRGARRSQRAPRWRLSRRPDRCPRGGRSRGRASRAAGLLRERARPRGRRGGRRRSRRRSTCSTGSTPRGGGPTWSSWTCRWSPSTASSRPA